MEWHAQEAHSAHAIDACRSISGYLFGVPFNQRHTFDLARIDADTL